MVNGRHLYGAFLICRGSTKRYTNGAPQRKLIYVNQIEVKLIEDGFHVRLVNYTYVLLLIRHI